MCLSCLASGGGVPSTRVLFTGGSLNPEGRMVVALAIGLVNLTMLYAALLLLRFSIENSRRRSEKLRQAFEEEGI